MCAHLLCEEDMSSFDPKLNDENLTKCMQSLKEFYRDLRTEQVSVLLEGHVASTVVGRRLAATACGPIVFSSVLTVTWGGGGGGGGGSTHTL